MEDVTNIGNGLVFGLRGVNVKIERGTRHVVVVRPGNLSPHRILQSQHSTRIPKIAAHNNKSDTGHIGLHKLTTTKKKKSYLVCHYSFVHFWVLCFNIFFFLHFNISTKKKKKT